MFFSRKASRAARPRARVPAGERVYAIGDVHGRLDLLTELVGQIAADDRGRPDAVTTLIFIGDLVDRGPDSAGVLRLVRALREEGRFSVRLIRGNHEEVLMLAAQGNPRAARALVQIGGEATIRSFGISDQEAASGNFIDLAELLRERLPRADIALLEEGEDLIEIGDYAFVHAGIRPGVPLAEQSVADLRWIRDEFLDSSRDHGKVVVHGHTVAAEIQDLPNRVGLDTGAFATGRLSAVGLEGGERWFLATVAPSPATCSAAPLAGSRPADILE